MSAKRKRVVVLDIGTTKVLLVVADVLQKGGRNLEVNIAGVGRSTSLGVRKGLVTHIEGATRAVDEAVHQAESMVDRPISRAIVNVSGSVVRGFNSYGIVGIADREVSSIDVERVLDAGRAVVLPVDQTVVHIVPQGFMVDQLERTRNPLGMSGVRLESRVHILASSRTTIDNLVRVVSGCNVSVERLVASPYMSALGALTMEERQLGALVLDFGGGTCDACLFRGGVVETTFVIPIGGNHITNDLAAGLRTSIVAAEEIKRDFGSVDSSDAAVVEGINETVEVSSGLGRSPRIVSQSIIASIIEARVREVFEIVKARLAEEQVDVVRLGGGVVITGGSSALNGLASLAEQVFGCPARCVGDSSISSGIMTLSSAAIAPELFQIGDFSTANGNTDSNISVSGLYNLVDGAEASVAIGMILHSIQDGASEMNLAHGRLSRAIKHFGAWLQSHF